MNAIKTKRVFAVVGIGIGAVMVLAGVILLIDGSVTVPGTTSFGGDAYTYIFSAARSAASGVSHLYEIAKAALVFAGVFTIALFGTKYAETLQSVSSVPEDVSKNNTLNEELPDP